MSTTTCPTQSYVSGHAAVAAATLVATLAHAGQVDKAGRPYVDHPRRVAAGLVDPSWQQLTVAWLHDVVEDTAVTLEALEQAFGPDIAGAVRAVTHRPGERRDDYYARVAANPLALAVKLADIADNTNPDRLAQLDGPTADRLRAKYAHALAVLGQLSPI